MAKVPGTQGYNKEDVAFASPQREGLQALGIKLKLVVCSDARP